jgi:hypothetical protein
LAIPNVPRLFQPTTTLPFTGEELVSRAAAPTFITQRRRVEKKSMAVIRIISGLPGE